MEARPTHCGDPVQIRWFVGLGVGTGRDQLREELAVLDGINGRYCSSYIFGILEAVPQEEAIGILNEQIAHGNGPDIIGPQGVQELSGVEAQWMDLSPFLLEIQNKANRYSLEDYPPLLVKYYEFPGGGQASIPYILFPSFTYYNRDLFDKAGAAYPPHSYSQPNSWKDGTQTDWGIAALSQLAMTLTLDAEGRNAAAPRFDPENIVQFGYLPQWDSVEDLATMFGSETFVFWDATQKRYRAAIPDTWRAAFDWYYQGIWKYHFIPNQEQTDRLAADGGGLFNSGKVAMVQTNRWFFEWIDPDMDWDIAAIPSFEGHYTVPMRERTFRIWAGSKSPNEAFKMLSELTTVENTKKLLPVYGGIPARNSARVEYIDFLNTTHYFGKVDWNVANASIDYLTAPNRNMFIPNYREFHARMVEFENLLMGTPGLDLDVELEKLRNDLEMIFNGG
jgi:multiple sugar transport system substrate-binding protein